jgi:flagellin FlaB
MTYLVNRFLERVRPLWRDQQGITGLETAIVLIAFVVVSSVFAFAALSTGLFTTDRAKETIHAGLQQARSTIELRGSVLVNASAAGTAGEVTSIRFQIATAAGGDAIDLTPGNTVIKYTDTTQTLNFDSDTEFTTSVVGAGDSDTLLERGEVFEVLVGPTANLQTLLATNLGTNDTFSLELVPPTGATLYIQRTTPVSLELLTNLN